MSQDEMSPVRQSSGMGCGWILLIVVLVLSLILNFVLMATVAVLAAGAADLPLPEKFHSGKRGASDKVAILRVEGLIADGEKGFVDRQVKQILEDESIVAVVLRIDSPGGSVSASDYQFHRIKQMLEERELPSTVSMGFLCASGGYYVAMAQGASPSVDGPVMYAEPTTWSGSIGVYVPLIDASELVENWGVKDTTIATAPLKKMGSMMEPFQPGEEEVWTNLVNHALDMFQERIRFGRPGLNNDQIDAVSTGQIFTTDQALANGLVDEEGFLQDAIQRVVALAGLEEDKYQVVEFDRPFRLFAGLTAGSAPEQDPVGRFARTLQPGAYFLWGGHQQMLLPAP